MNFFLTVMAPCKETKCKICSKNVTKTQSSVQCFLCTNWFHVSCAGISDGSFAALAETLCFAHRCEDCLRSSPSSISTIADDIRSLKAAMDLILKKMDSDRNDFNAKLDSAIKEIRSDLSSNVTELRNDIVFCHSAIKRVETTTTSTLGRLRMENNGLHRKINRPDIVINGLPAGLSNLYQCLEDTCLFYKINITKSDVNNICYINKERSVLVKFNSVLIRDDVMRAYFKTKSLKLSDVMETEISSRVYLNDHLPPATSKLNGICRRLYKEKKILKFVLIHSDIPKARLFLADGTEVVYDFDNCFKLL